MNGRRPTQQQAKIIIWKKKKQSQWEEEEEEVEEKAFEILRYECVYVLRLFCFQIKTTIEYINVFVEFTHL